MSVYDVANTIVQQLDYTKPDYLKPKVDVGMTPLKDGVKVMIRARPRPDHELHGIGREAVVTYDHGHDTYNVVVHEQGATGTTLPRVYGNVYVDQLGELVWGPEAKPFDLPMSGVLEWREDETMEEALRRGKQI